MIVKYRFRNNIKNSFELRYDLYLENKSTTGENSLIIDFQTYE